MSAFLVTKIFKLQGLEDTEMHRNSATKTVEMQHISHPLLQGSSQALPCPFNSFYTAVIFSLIKFC